MLSHVRFELDVDVVVAVVLCWWNRTACPLVAGGRGGLHLLFCTYSWLDGRMYAGRESGESLTGLALDGQSIPLPATFSLPKQSGGWLTPASNHHPMPPASQTNSHLERRRRRRIHFSRHLDNFRFHHLFLAPAHGGISRKIRLLQLSRTACRT